MWAQNDARSAYTGEGAVARFEYRAFVMEGGVSVPVAKSDASAAETLSGHFQEPIIPRLNGVRTEAARGATRRKHHGNRPYQRKVLKVDVSFTLVK